MKHTNFAIWRYLYCCTYSCFVLNNRSNLQKENITIPLFCKNGGCIEFIVVIQIVEICIPYIYWNTIDVKFHCSNYYAWTSRIIVTDCMGDNFFKYTRQFGLYYYDVLMSSAQHLSHTRTGWSHPLDGTGFFVLEQSSHTPCPHFRQWWSFASCCVELLIVWFWIVELFVWDDVREGEGPTFSNRISHTQQDVISSSGTQ